MRNIRALYSVLTKNTEMKLPKKGGKGTMYLALGIIAAFCIMLPCCFIVGFVSYVMTSALIEARAPMAGLATEIHIMSAFSVVFGMLVIFNVLFFSSDREHLVPLPFKSHEILAAKFLYSYMAESVMEFIILLSMFIGFFIAVKPGIVSSLSAVIAVALIPMVPLAYCAIVGMLIMALLRNVKSTKVFDHISTIFLLLFIVLFLFSFKDMGGINIENYVYSLATNSNLFNNVLNKVFFTVPLLVTAIEKGSLLHLLLYIAGNALVVGIMLLLGHLLYQDSLFTVGRLGSREKTEKINLKGNSKKTIFATYMQKEFKVLMRTKAYNNNCVYVNLLWAVLLVLYLILNRNKESLSRIVTYYQEGNANLMVFIGIAVVLLSFIATAMNSLASTAFTREGQHLSLIKYIPVPYKMQLWCKGLISVVITFPAIALCIIIWAAYIKMQVFTCIFYLLISLLCIIITTVIGLVLDSSAPHSDWDDEYSALRGNLNTFFDMAVVMVISLLICAIGFLLYNFTKMGVLGFNIYLLLVAAVGTFICLTYGVRRTLTNMEEL